VVPSHLYPLIYSYFHVYMGNHLGINRTIDSINKIFYWPNSRAYITQRVHNCLTCQKSKTDLTGTKGKLSSIVPRYPGETIFIDTVGPLVPSFGYNYILICVDGFSRYTWLIPLRKCTSQVIINALKTNIFQNFGLFYNLVSDNAAYFKSKIFTNFLFSLGINHRLLIRFYPNPNISERSISGLKSALIAYNAENQTQWAQSLFTIQLTINNAQNSSHKFSPAEVFLNRQLITHINVVWDLPNLHASPTNIITEAYKNLLDSHRSLEIKYNRSHKFVKLNIGDKVLIKSYILSDKSKNIAAKLSYKYTDPYVVTKILSDVTYELRSIHSPTDIKKAHISQLKLVHLD